MSSGTDRIPLVSGRGSFCRITQKSVSMEEYKYVPYFKYLRPDQTTGCRITQKSLGMGDYKYIYPIIDQTGKTKMISEHEFHCRITAKYHAMAGHKYIYPVLARNHEEISRGDLIPVTTDDDMIQDVLVPDELHIIINGSIHEVLKNKNGTDLYISGKEGDIFPAGIKTIIICEKKVEGKVKRNRTAPLCLNRKNDSICITDLHSSENPRIKTLKDVLKRTKDEGLMQTSWKPEIENVGNLQRKKEPKNVIISKFKNKYTSTKSNHNFQGNEKTENEMPPSFESKTTEKTRIENLQNVSLSEVETETKDNQSLDKFQEMEKSKDKLDSNSEIKLFRQKSVDDLKYKEKSQNELFAKSQTKETNKFSTENVQENKHIKLTSFEFKNKKRIIQEEQNIIDKNVISKSLTDDCNKTFDSFSSTRYETSQSKGNLNLCDGLESKVDDMCDSFFIYWL
ncbi:uncharacterized protein LOC143253092 [Tachypleus tridentatus]|uniref:uncharacterized protein LOC143253092 n=1 Tax=Tachypleus tridentatus TaxID=6853 RepID=UPI003FD3400D